MVRQCYLQDTMAVLNILRACVSRQLLIHNHKIKRDQIPSKALLEQSSFSNLSVTSPTSQLNFQPFRRFTYVTAHSPTLPLLHLRHCSLSNPSFASPTSQDFHLIHLASRPMTPSTVCWLRPYYKQYDVNKTEQESPFSDKTIKFRPIL